MADYYVDFSTGNDTTGDGTSGTPWKTCQKAVDSGTWSTSGGNNLYVGDNAAEVLTSAITWSAGLLANDGIDNPFIFRHWANGGSLTSTMPNGNTRSVSEIDGNDAVASITSGTMQFVVFYRLKMHGTTSYVIDEGNGMSLIECELYDGGSVNALIDGSTWGKIINCHIHSDGVNLGEDGHEAVDLSLGNFIDGFDGKGIRMGTGGIAVYNTVKDCDEGGIDQDGDRAAIIHNSFAGNATASEVGVLITGAGADANIIAENIIADYSGTSAVGFNIDAAGSENFSWGNRYYNNTTNESFTGTSHLSVDNSVDSQDPYTDPDTDDYAPPTNSDSYQAAGNPGGKAQNIGADLTDKALVPAGGSAITSVGGKIVSV